MAELKQRRSCGTATSRGPPTCLDKYAIENYQYEGKNNTISLQCFIFIIIIIFIYF